MTFIETRLAERSNMDAAIAFAVICTDPATATPARLLEHGPWWLAAQSVNAPAGRKPVALDQLCAVCGQVESRCQVLAQLPDDGHDFTPVRTDTPTAPVRDPLAHIDAIRRELDARRFERTAAPDSTEEPDTTTEKELDHAV
jgi:hypothetical protein